MSISLKKLELIKAITELPDEIELEDLYESCNKLFNKKSDLEKLLDFSEIGNKEIFDYSIIFNGFYKVFSKLLDYYKIKLVKSHDNLFRIYIKNAIFIEIYYGNGDFKIVLNEEEKETILYSISYLAHDYLFTCTYELIKLNIYLRNDVTFVEEGNKIIHYYNEIQPCKYDINKELIYLVINTTCEDNLGSESLEKILEYNEYYIQDVFSSIKNLINTFMKFD